jgi:membrane protein involved in colicin uptake
MPTYMQATQKAAAVKATAEQKAAQKQAKADTSAKEPAEEPAEELDVGGEVDFDEEEEEGSAPARSGRVPDEESSDDGDETGRCLGCGGSKSIGKVSFC